MLEIAGTLAFLIVAIIGFKTTLWWVAGALAAHGIFDWFHPQLIGDPGVPSWWPAFCMSYDVAAAAYLSWLLLSSRLSARSRQPSRAA
jgi:hypothetical protein